MSTNPPTDIIPSDIEEIAGVVQTSVINDFAVTLGVDLISADAMEVDSNAVRAKNFDAIRKTVKGIIRQGYSASQVISQVSLLTI